MKKDNVVNIGFDALDAKQITPEMVLRESLKELGESRAFKQADKLIVIALDDTDGEYTVSWNQANMSTSQILALLEVTKTVTLQQMGFI